MSYHAQACMGVETCAAALLLGDDASFKHPDTLAGVVSCLRRIQAVVADILPSEPVCRGKLAIRSLMA